MEMIEKRDHSSIRIEAKIDVSTLDEMGWKNFAGVRSDTRLSFYANGLHHDSFVEEIDGVIPPGESGRVTFSMASAALFETDVAVGSKVELRAGPIVVAIAEILSMKRVFVKRDSSSERGYVILDEESEQDLE
ncbi:MAG: hypothetical protein AAGD92_16080 [Pseudomonadota bacterium]